MKDLMGRIQKNGITVATEKSRKKSLWVSYLYGIFDRDHGEGFGPITHYFIPGFFTDQSHRNLLYFCLFCFYRFFTWYQKYKDPHAYFYVWLCFVSYFRLFFN